MINDENSMIRIHTNMSWIRNTGLKMSKAQNYVFWVCVQKASSSIREEVGRGCSG
jgi:hypothetical protein